MRRVLVTLLAMLLSAVPALADHTSHTGSHSHAPQAPVPYDSKGLGPVHHAVSTSNPEAQRLFDQGLALCYAFNHDEAVRSFERALEADPRLAMAHWGIAYALGPNINLATDSARAARAYDEIQQARRLAASATPAEREWIEAMAMRYASPPPADRASLELGYRAAMRELYHSHLDDPDAGAIYAESIMDLTPWDYWLPSGAPKPDTEELLRVLEDVLAKHPDHVGANHYYIHAVEASPHPERAMASAKRLETLSPDAGHLVHMPSHILQRTGDYWTSAQLNVRAARVDSAYVTAHRVEGAYPMMYWNHNHDFAAAAFVEVGRYRDAMKHARFVQENIVAMARSMPMVEFFGTRPYAIMVAFRRWDDALAAPEPAPHLLTSRLSWRFARGSAYAAKGNLAAARVELDSLEAGLARLPADYIMGTNVAPPVMAVPRAQLAGRIARATGDVAGAERELRAAIAAFDAIRYDEPEEWLLSPRLDLGALLLSAGRAAEAVQVYRDELRLHPKSGRALHGLAAAQQAAGMSKDAALTRQQFAAAWKHADRPLGPADL